MPVIGHIEAIYCVWVHRITYFYLDNWQASVALMEQREVVGRAS
jgi:hypothetical protein